LPKSSSGKVLIPHLIRMVIKFSWVVAAIDQKILLLSIPQMWNLERKGSGFESGMISYNNILQFNSLPKESPSFRVGRNWAVPEGIYAHKLISWCVFCMIRQSDTWNGRAPPFRRDKTASSPNRSDARGRNSLPKAWDSVMSLADSMTEDASFGKWGASGRTRHNAVSMKSQPPLRLLILCGEASHGL